MNIYTAKLKKNRQTGEWRVKYYRNEIWMGAAVDYFTDDKDDAVLTAQAEVERMTEKDEGSIGHPPSAPSTSEAVRSEAAKRNIQRRKALQHLAHAFKALESSAVSTDSIEAEASRVISRMCSWLHYGKPFRRIMSDDLRELAATIDALGDDTTLVG
jgi:hypothetical protein